MDPTEGMYQQATKNDPKPATLLNTLMIKKSIIEGYWEEKVYPAPFRKTAWGGKILESTVSLFLSE